MTQSLHRLTYFSRCLIRGPYWFVEAEIGRLLAVARPRNASLGITGSLLFNNGCFAQILEGPRPALDRMFAVICADPRHGEVTLLQPVAAVSRAFPNWSMRYIGQPSEARRAGASDLLFERIDRAARWPGAPSPP